MRPSLERTSQLPLLLRFPAPWLNSAVQRRDAGSNNVTAGPIDLSSAQTPALLVALSMNTFGGTSDTGGTGFGGPTAGNGMTPVEMTWNWGANLATFPTASVTGAESVSSLFSASGAGSYVTVAAAFH